MIFVHSISTLETLLKFTNFAGVKVLQVIFWNLDKIFAVLKLKTQTLQVTVLHFYGGLFVDDQIFRVVFAHNLLQKSMTLKVSLFFLFDYLLNLDSVIPVKLFRRQMLLDIEWLNFNISFIMIWVVRISLIFRKISTKWTNYFFLGLVL